MALTVDRKYLVFRWTAADLTLSPGNAPWLSNVLKIVGYTVPGSTGLNNQSAYQGSFGGLTAGGTLQKLVQNQDYLLISGRYDGWNLAPAIAVSMLTGAALPALAAPTGGQATATSTSALSVVASSVANATGYQLYTSASQNGAYAKLGGVLTTPSFAHTGLSAGQTQWYEWQALGDSVNNVSSALGTAFSGTTQVGSTIIELTPFGDSRTANETVAGGYTSNWPAKLLSLLNDSRYTLPTNYGIPGAYTDYPGPNNDASSVTAQVATYNAAPKNAANKRVAIVAIGINDAQNLDTLATFTAHYTHMIQQVKAAGFNKVVVVNLITSRFVNFTDTRHNQIFTLVLQYNKWLNDNYVSLGIDVLCNVYSDRILYGYDAPLNLTNFQNDQIHYRDPAGLATAKVISKGVVLAVNNNTGIVVSDDPYVAPATGTQVQPPGTSAPTFVDDFERPDGDVGNNWLNPEFFQLSSGAAVAADSFPSGHKPMLRPLSEAGNRQRATATVFWNNSGLTYALLNRADNSGNYYMAYFTDHGTGVDINIFRINNYTSVTPVATTAITTGLTNKQLYRLTFVVYGSTLVANVLNDDGTSAAGVSGTDSNLPSGVCGMSAANVGPSFLDFQVATV